MGPPGIVVADPLRQARAQLRPGLERMQIDAFSVNRGEVATKVARQLAEFFNKPKAEKDPNGRLLPPAILVRWDVEAFRG